MVKSLQHLIESDAMMGRPVTVCVYVHGGRACDVTNVGNSFSRHSFFPSIICGVARRGGGGLSPPLLASLPLPLPPSVIPGVPESRRKPPPLPPSRGPSSASVTPAAPAAAAAAAVGLLLQVVERVHHVLQTVHVVPTKTVVVVCF